jgi:hypothetical protein
MILGNEITLQFFKSNIRKFPITNVPREKFRLEFVRPQGMLRIPGQAIVGLVS